MNPLANFAVSIRRYNGKWTIYAGEQPVLICNSFIDAWFYVYGEAH